MIKTQTSFVQNNIACFLNTFKSKSDLEFHGVGGMANIYCGEIAICLGDYEGDEAVIKIDQKDFTRYIRAAKSGTVISLEVAVNESNGDLSLVLNSDSAGEFVLNDKHPCKVKDRVNLFDVMGEFKFTVPFDTIAKANSICDRCDIEATRYALNCVLLDDDRLVATDGRRLVTINGIQPAAPSTMLPLDLIKYAIKFKFEIDVYDKYIVAGDCMMPVNGGRFPDYKRVLPAPEELANRFVLDGDDLRKAASKQIAKAKAAGDNDDRGFTVKLDDTMSVKLDAHFVLAAIGKSKAINVACGEQNVAKGVTSPVVVTSDETPNQTEVIMPMAMQN